VPAWTIAVAGFQLRLVSAVIALSKNKKTGRKSRAGFLIGPFSDLFNVAASRPANHHGITAPLRLPPACVNDYRR
jgi:hypothetical protein